MRLILNFETDKNVLNRDYRPAILSMLKRVLNGVYPEIFNEEYDNNKVKNFSFSLYLPKIKREDKNITFQNNFAKIIISSSDSWLITYMFNAFLIYKNYNFNVKGTIFNLTSLNMRNLENITENEVSIKFLSPLLVRQHDRKTNLDRYVTFDEEDFVTIIKNNMTNLRDLDVDDIYTFDIKPIKAKKNIDFSMGMSYLISEGVFLIKGNTKLLNYLYENGLGSRRGQGFGLFEIKKDV